MMRRATARLAPSIPRSVWDPTRANPNWADSYALDVADRRQWPAKRWSLGLEPRTPTDWLSYSPRNLAYAYNGALRACTTFPDMVQYYQEMKLRGVAVDLDTMNVLLTRAARYEKIVADDVFALFEEMLSLGAKPDMSVIETLHTVYDHHFTATTHAPEWREMRRRRLVELYNTLCSEEIGLYATKNVPDLLQAQVQRYRENLQLLGSVLSATNMCQYVGQVEDPQLLVSAIHDYLWDFVPKDHPCADIKALGLQIPRVASVLRRPTAANSSNADPQVEQFDDAGLNRVFATAVERVIDTGMTSRRFPTERSVLLALINCFWQSGVFVASTVMATFLDAVKFSPDEQFRDQDAMRYFTFAKRVSSVAKDSPQAALLWTALRPIVDGRVVGRFLAARDPWSGHSFTPSPSGAFPLVSSDGSGDGAPAAVAASVLDVGGVPTSTALVATGGGAGGSQRTATALARRWADVKGLVDSTGVLRAPAGGGRPLDLDACMEVFTGQVCFLRNVLLPARYASASAAAAWATVPPDVAQQVFTLLKEVKQDLDVFIASHPTAVPEVEAVEGMLMVTRALLDMTLLSLRDGAQDSSGGDSSGSSAQRQVFFRAVAEARAQLLAEARSRFDGRFRVLWLQES